MKKYINTVLIVALFIGATARGQQKNVHPIISAEEMKLYNLIMEYRKTNGLALIPLSKSLTFVAQTHCADLYNNGPDLKPGCNPHSWSDKGKWTGCCYTADHKQAQHMWDKPREITNYKDNGFEIAYGESANKDFPTTAESALAGWQSSIHHNDVILNKDIWRSFTWNAIGIGIYHGFAAVWFGASADAEGQPELK